MLSAMHEYARKYSNGTRKLHDAKHAIDLYLEDDPDFIRRTIDDIVFD
jgi:hypothetical protein